jgi:hypothetical protein
MNSKSNGVTWLRQLFDTARTRVNARPFVATMLAGIGVLLLAGFASQSSDDAPGASNGLTSAAIDRFWAVYHGNNYDAIPQVQQQLEVAIQNDPNNPTLHALLGATHFWHVGELARDPIPNDPVLPEDMSDAVDSFQKALQLDYYTQHPIGYINDDHLPGYLGITTVHLGQQHNDQDLINKGDQILDFAVYQFPEFNNFNRWAARLTEPRGSASYNEGLNSLWQALDTCIGGMIDRNNPDIGPYLNLVTSVGRKKACWWDNNIAPYAFEGIMLNLGNGLIKAGQVPQARIVFANARYAKNYDTWPYRPYFEQLVNSNLYARAAMYANDDNDPSKDPPLTVPNRSCSYCHATVPEHDAPPANTQQ